jgi:hypothetical protein
MISRPGRQGRAWPLWLLGLAMVSLVLFILLMQRSYRQQLDASMAQLQHSVAAARLQQERLTEHLQYRKPSLAAAANAAVATGGGAQPATASIRGQEAAIGERLQRVATELDLLSREGGYTVPNRADWLDWSRVRAELWSLSRAIRQYRPGAAGRNGSNPAAVRDWVSRAQSAANQEKPAALITALSGIQRQLVEQGRLDPNAERLARQAARLSAVLGFEGLSASERERLRVLASETSAVAQRIQELASNSGAERRTPR